MSPELFSEARVTELLESAGITSFDPSYLKKFVRTLNAGAATFRYSIQRRAERSAAKQKRAQWSAFLRRIEIRCRELADEIGNAEDELFRQLADSLPAVEDLNRYRFVGTNGWPVLFDFRNVWSSGPEDFYDLEDFILIVATMGKLAEHLSNEQSPGKAGAPSIDHLDAFVFGVALSYERLTGRRFTHRGFADGKTGREPVTTGGRLVGLILQDLAQTDKLTLPPSSQETACARAVSKLRRLRAHKATLYNSGSRKRASRAET
jgi:hypothetical protein